MTNDRAAPTFVVGLGCQRGCPASTLRALLDQALQAHRIELQTVKALASIDLKRDEPGLQELAAQLALPLLYFSSEELASYQERLSHRSEIAYERTGCYGVAESAALALAEQLIQAPAKLLISDKNTLRPPSHWPVLHKFPIIPATDHEQSSSETIAAPPFSQDSTMTVYFIGAGPGDPELITVKGQRLIRSCTVIIYAGSLVPAAVLDGHQAQTVVNSAELHLEQIIELIKTAHANGEDVARVHSGDPSLYGAIGEQIRYLRELNIPFEIIPGVTATAACAALLGAELTLPDVSQSVILTRYADKTAMPAGEELGSLAQHGATMAIHLGVNHLQKILAELLPHYGADCPIAVIHRATWPDQDWVVGTLADIAGKVEAKGFRRTALILVGRVLGSEVFSESSLYHAGHAHLYRP